MLTLQIKRWGNSSAIRIPNSLLQQLGWKEDDEIKAELIDNKIIFSKVSKTISLNQNDVQTLSESGVDVQALVNDFLAHEAIKFR